MTTITTKQQQAIADTLAKMTLPRGLGTTDNACSIAAINLALTGVLTDTIPECMSEVIGTWIIVAQDWMPDEMRNSAEWKRLLPLAAGTGCKREKERLEIILDWMWGTVLPTVQPIADANGFGEEWRMMLQQRTIESAYVAYAAADAAAKAAKVAYATAAYDAEAAAAEAAAYAAADAAAKAAKVAYAYAVAEAATATATARAAAYDATICAVRAANATADYADAWQQFNPCGLLQRLIEV